LPEAARNRHLVWKAARGVFLRDERWDTVLFGYPELAMSAAWVPYAAPIRKLMLKDEIVNYVEGYRAAYDLPCAKASGSRHDGAFERELVRRARFELKTSAVCSRLTR